MIAWRAVRFAVALLMGGLLLVACVREDEVRRDFCANTKNDVGFCRVDAGPCTLEPACLCEPGFDGGRMIQARVDHQAVAIGCEVWVLGGRAPFASPVSTVEIYDVRTNSWRRGPAMATRRDSFVAARVGDHLVVAGGAGAFGYSASSEMLDLRNPDAGWSDAGLLPEGISTFDSFPLGEELVFVGGEFPGGSGVSGVYAWNKAQGWRREGTLPLHHEAHATALIPPATLLAIGGSSNGRAITRIDGVVGQDGRFTVSSVVDAGVLGDRRAFATAVTEQNAVWVLGGWTNGGTNLGASVEKIDLEARTVDRDGANQLFEPRARAAVAPFGDGEYLVAGVRYSGATLSAAPPAAYVYEVFSPGNPSRRRQFPVGEELRTYVTATPLPNGGVLVVGGHGLRNGTEGPIPEILYPDGGVRVAGPP